MSDIFLGSRVQRLQVGNPDTKITKVILYVDSDVSYVVGDDTGATIETSCPWGSQEMAENILSKIKGFGYKSYTAEKAMVDPAFEIGDSVAIGKFNSTLVNAETNLNRAFLSQISAPEVDENTDEYPGGGSSSAKIERKLAYTRALITKSSSEIRLEIEDTENRLNSTIVQTTTSIRTELSDDYNEKFTQVEASLDGIETRITNEVEGLESSISQTASTIRSEIEDVEEGLSTRITQTSDSLSASIKSVDGRVTTINTQLESITTKVEDAEGNIGNLQLTATSLTSRISSAEGDISSIEQELDSITARVSSTETGLSQTLRIAPDGVTITNSKGSSVTIDGGQINAESLNLTGVITFGDLTTSLGNRIVYAEEDAADALDEAAAAYERADEADTNASNAQKIAKQIANGTYSGGTFIDGTSIVAPEIAGGNIYGGKFDNLEGTSWIEVGKDTEDGSPDTDAFDDDQYILKIYNYNWNKAVSPEFMIWGDYMDLLEISAKGNPFITISAYDTTYPNGTWDFRNATVENLSVEGVTAVFA